MKDFCPRCGAGRIGAFRFCTGCQLDFDGIVTTLGGTPDSLPAAAVPSASKFPRRGIFVAGLAIVIGLAAIGSLDKSETGTPKSALATATSTAQIVAVATATPTAEPTPIPEPTFGPIGQTTEATVVRVTDGDTIVVAYGGQEYRVRYIGVDTPETVDHSSPVQWLGPQATAANAALVAGKTVFLEKDVSEVDQFDRLLRYVWLTDGTAWTLVNLELVRQGFAAAISYPPDVTYDGLYSVAQADAQASGRGRWGPTPAPPTAPPTPKPAPKPTPKPVAKATPKPTAKPKPPSKCHPSYAGVCLKQGIGDYDCAGGSGNGPNYVEGPVKVVGPDEFRLDADDDGIGCE